MYSNKSLSVCVTQMSQFIVQCLNPYRKPDCKLGRISNTEDFKHLARKVRLNKGDVWHEQLELPLMLRSLKPFFGLGVVRAQRKHWSAFHLKGNVFKVSLRPELNSWAPTISLAKCFVLCLWTRLRTHCTCKLLSPSPLFYSFLSKSSFWPAFLQRAAFCFSVFPGRSMDCVYISIGSGLATWTYQDSEDMGTITRKTSLASLI